MIKFLEQGICDKYEELLGLTEASLFENGVRNIQAFDRIIDVYDRVDALEKKLERINAVHERANSVIESNLFAASSFVRDRIAKSSVENKYSKLFLPKIVDGSSDSVIIKNGTIYGTFPNGDRNSNVVLSTDNMSTLYYMPEKIVKGKVITTDKDITIKPIEKLGRRSRLIISINLNRIELIQEINIDLDKSRKTSIFFKEPGYDTYTFLEEVTGSIIKAPINRNITDVKLIVDVSTGDRSEGAVKFNRLEITRYALSEDTSVDIKTDINSNGSTVSLTRCDSGTGNIKYYTSVDGRPFKDATHGPVRTYGIEDGEVYTLPILNRLTEDREVFSEFLIDADVATIQSNEWVVFLGRNKYKEVYYGSIGFYECHAVYRDVFEMTLPAGKYIYINGEKYSGTFKVFSGTHKIKIPMAMFTLSHNMDFYTSVEYDGITIKLLKQDGTYDTVASTNDVFAQIETTAAHLFSGRIDNPEHIPQITESPNGGTGVELGIIRIKTEENTAYCGFIPRGPAVSNIVVRIEFTKSLYTAEVNHLAIKLY